MNLPGFENIPGLSSRMIDKIPQLITGLIRHPVNDPVYSAEMEKGLGVTGPEIRAAISYLRTLRLPIGSGANGYFWAKWVSDLSSTIQHLEGRATRIRRTADGLKSAYCGMTIVAQVLTYLDGIKDKQQDLNL